MKKQHLLFAAIIVISSLCFSQTPCEISDEMLYPYSKNKLYGLVDKDFKVVVEAKYPQVGKFSDGMCFARQDNPSSYTFIDSKGNVMNKVFKNAFSFSGGYALVEDLSGNIFYINKKGEKVTTTPINELAKFTNRVDMQVKNGLVKYKGTGGRAGFMKPTGEIVIDAKYPYANNFSEGLCAVTIGDKTGFIDTTGKIVIQPNYLKTGDFHNGYVLVYYFVPGGTGTYNCGIIDKTGQMLLKNVVVKYSYDDMGETVSGNSKVRFEDIKNFVNGTATFYIGGLNDVSIGYIYNSEAGVSSPKEKKKGAAFLSKLAEVALEDPNSASSQEESSPFKIKTFPGKHEAIGNFMCGVAPVKKDGKWGAISMDGKLIIQPTFDELSDFNNGIASFFIRDGAMVNGEYVIGFGYINISGKIVTDDQVKK